ncbi:MAG: hypothetical protein FWG40_12920 [Peptococcaceae bacterium]|nr:hypothetical protein [Peptococcaceae bacterium]
MFFIHTLALTIEDADTYYRWRTETKHRLKKDKDGLHTDYAFHNQGMRVQYDGRHTKKVKLIVNPSRVLGCDDLDPWKPSGKNVKEFLEELEELITEYFHSEVTLNNFRLSRVDFTRNLNVGRENVSDYIRFLHCIGKVKGFSPSFDKHDYDIRGINKANSFDLTGNSNGIEFSAYDKEAAIEDIAAKLKRKEADSRLKLAKGILRVEVRLTKVKAIRKCTDETAASKQIKDLYRQCEDIFMQVFLHIVPRGYIHKKKRAGELVKERVSKKSHREKMLRLLELIPEQKSILLAQKKLNIRDIDRIMKLFAEINVSPVTISKRHDVKELDSLYSFMD